MGPTGGPQQGPYQAWNKYMGVVVVVDKLPFGGRRDPKTHTPILN